MTKTGIINGAVLPLGEETVVGSITLDPGIWFILAGVWNPLGMKTIAISVQNAGIGQLITAQHVQTAGWVKATERRTYNIVCTQWDETSVELISGEVKAIRLK